MVTDLAGEVVLNAQLSLFSDADASSYSVDWPDLTLTEENKVDILKSLAGDSGVPSRGKYYAILSRAYGIDAINLQSMNRQVAVDQLVIGIPPFTKADLRPLGVGGQRAEAIQAADNLDTGQIALVHGTIEGLAGERLVVQ